MLKPLDIIKNSTRFYGELQHIGYLYLLFAHISMKCERNLRNENLLSCRVPSNESFQALIN